MQKCLLVQKCLRVNLTAVQICLRAIFSARANLSRAILSPCAIFSIRAILSARAFLTQTRWQRVELKSPFAQKTNIKFDSNLITTVDEWQLVRHIIVLLEPIYIVTQQCSKTNTLLSSVNPHAQALKNIFNIYANSPKNSSVSTI